MIKIRVGVFETNSSSVHSMIMCSGDEYEKLKSGELLIEKWGNKLMTLEEAKEEYRDVFRLNTFHGENIDDVPDDKVMSLLSEWDIAVSLDEWLESNEYMENFEEKYITSSGEVVYAFGYYGHD